MVAFLKLKSTLGPNCEISSMAISIWAIFGRFYLVCIVFNAWTFVMKNVNITKLRQI